MAVPRDFAGSNKRLVSPVGLESIILPLPVYGSGRESISCWELSDAELAVINESRCIWVSVAGGMSQPPIGVSGFPMMEARDCDGILIKYNPDDPVPPGPIRGIETLDVNPLILPKAPEGPNGRN